jgi:phospholipid/cholesterol/gamma-HCH transport system substrate-binding protein
MPPRLSWRRLLPGLIASAAVALTAVGILVFAGVGRIRGQTVRLYVLTDQARGVMKGTDVWIAGQKVGTVDAIDFRTPSADTLGRVVIAVSVRKDDAQQIRLDSRAQVRAGANMIGPVVVYVTSGSPGSPMVKAGDTLRARQQSDFELAGVKFTAATDNLGPIMADARTVMANVRNPHGTVGAVLTEQGGGEVARLRTRVAALRARMFGGARSEAVARTMDAARSALSRVDSVRTLLASPNRSFGRFRRDSTLRTAVGRLSAELTELNATLAENDGTLARVKTDSALTRSVADAQKEMALLFADLKRRPLRYLHF